MFTLVPSKYCTWALFPLAQSINTALHELKDYQSPYCDCNDKIILSVMKNVSKHSETEQKKQKGEIPSAAFSDRPDISIQVFYLPVFI